MMRSKRFGIILSASLFASSAMAAGQDALSPHDAAVLGGAYAAGEAIGTAAIGGQGGYDGGVPTGRAGGPGPADRPCFVRRPVYDEDGTLIGYRGRQLC